MKSLPTSLLVDGSDTGSGSTLSSWLCQENAVLPNDGSPSLSKARGGQRGGGDGQGPGAGEKPGAGAKKPLLEERNLAQKRRGGLWVGVKAVRGWPKNVK